MERNEDYRKGMRLLLHKCKENKINIRRLHWVCDFSNLLSKYDACYKFWFNVDKQMRLHRVPFCSNVFEMMYGYGKTLFVWDKTEEGATFWFNMFTKKLFPNTSVLTNVNLNDIRRFSQ